MARTRRGVPTELKALVTACRTFPREHAPRLALLDWCHEYSDYVRAAIEVVMERHQDLTADGFGVGRVRGESLDAGERRRAFARAQLREAVRLPPTHYQFALALVWLATRAPRTKYNTRADSYAMKHLAERDTDERGYVSSGMLLCAAILLGIRCKPSADVPNGVLAISTALLGERERLRAEKEARRVEWLRTCEERRRVRCFLPPLTALSDAMGGTG